LLERSWVKVGMELWKAARWRGWVGMEFDGGDDGDDDGDDDKGGGGGTGRTGRKVAPTTSEVNEERRVDSRSEADRGWDAWEEQEDTTLLR